MATLQGYQRKNLIHRTYPGLVISPKESVQGIVYLGVNQNDLQYLHEYEHEYTPINVTVFTEKKEAIKAIAYLYRWPEKTTEEVWDPKKYEK